ncbi:MAG: short-chain dehydrogenase, partial [Candidatus Competibacteraceae bacterium]|nr:short-chain dehydrogenase [Candidatus Competibacteraceae bacterium]
TLAAELAGTGVNVTALCPTVVPTNIVNDGKLPEKRREFARAAMTRFALITADKVARQTLDTLDRGELYMLPQIDGRMAWRFKRLMPRLYTRIVGETYHLLAD